MAYFSAKHFSLLFIALVFSAPQVKARESRSFSKVIRRDNAVDNNLKVTEISLAKSPAPAPAPAPELAAAPVPAPSSDPEPTEYGYGLYGSEEGSASSTEKYIPSATDVVDGESTLTEELLVGGNEGRFETRYDRSNGNSNNNNYYYYNGNYRKDGQQQLQQQGMSDTRFLDNGRYYHGVKSDETNNINENENENESVGDNNYYYNGGFGINSRESAESERYEFDSMEEYEKYQENHGHLP